MLPEGHSVPFLSPVSACGLVKGFVTAWRKLEVKYRNPSPIDTISSRVKGLNWGGALHLIRCTSELSSISFRSYCIIVSHLFQGNAELPNCAIDANFSIFFHINFKFHLHVMSLSLYQAGFDRLSVTSIKIVYRQVCATVDQLTTSS